MDETQISTGSIEGGLNDAQRLAVETLDGPVLVVAGAGTGKTRVIVERVMRLIDQGIAPESILALTFTEKAAGEMLDRVNSMRQGITLDATIATFNGFGNDLLQAYGPEWGLGVIRLLGETGQLVFMREHLDEFELDYFAPVSKPDGQLSLLAGYVSLLKQQLVEPEEYISYADNLPTSDDAARLEKRKHQELARFYATYIRLCRENQFIDYDDQLFLTIGMLKARPNILKQLQTRYRYIMVDEFQDTNPMQSALVDLLAGKHRNIMVVGDDDQSIYGWRGATLANILDFKVRYPEATEVTLTENYRSSQPILDSAYALIQGNNPERLEVMNHLSKQLHSQLDDGVPPQAIHFSTIEAEMTWIAEDISRRLAAGQDPSSIAVLARRNAGVQKIHETLELYDVAHAVSGLSNDVYDQNAVRQLIEGLKAVGDPLDDMALFHTLGGPMFGLDPGKLSAIAASSRREHGSLGEAIHASNDEAAIKALQSIESWRTAAQDMPIGRMAYQMITDSGWKQQLYDQAEDNLELLIEVQALSKYFKTLKEFERIADVASVQNYIVNLPALRAAGSGFDDATLDISDVLVNVLSVHRAKGLEWGTVYVVDCTEGSFPMRSFGAGLQVPDQLKANQSAADQHMHEERRLMYVAATRARRELILTHADQHGSGALRKPSRFLAELLGRADASVLHEEAKQTNLELFAPRATTETVPLPSHMKPDGHIMLSVSQIDCWLRCPQDFYYIHVLQMPLPPEPALQYGTIVHGVIEKIHQGRRNDNPPSLEDLRTYALSSLPMTGYASARSRERAHHQAQKTVEAIYERFMHAPLPIEAELPFGIMLPDIKLKIIGRIDAVYQLDEGVEIRDFKTGTSVTTPDKAKRRATASNQLALYALAWRQMHDDMPALLTLDFVETGQQGSVKKQAKSLATLTSKLENMVESLQRGEYPSGKDHTFCNHPLAKQS